MSCYFDFLDFLKDFNLILREYNLIMIFLSKIFFLIFKKHELVFFSESRFYTKYYTNFIQELEDRNYEILYLSSDEKEKINSSKVKQFYIGMVFLDR